MIDLAQLTTWIAQRKPFLQVRVNDGEFICMFRMRPADTKNNCGHYYYTDLGDALLRIFDEWKVDLDTGRDTNCIALSSYCVRQQPKDIYAQRFIEHLHKLGIYDRVQWMDDDEFIWSYGTETPYRLVDAIRNREKVIFVCNPNNVPAKYALGAEALVISRYNCWKNTPYLLEICRPYAERGALFVWCCGMAKSWAWDLHREFPQSSHIDFGHAFDAVFGENSRAWFRSRDCSRWPDYENRWTPYIKGFVP